MPDRDQSIAEGSKKKLEIAARLALSGDRATWEWGCSKCKGEEFAEGDRLRPARNCDGETNQGLGFMWMPSLQRCPWSQITAETWIAFNWAVDHERFGILPWGGNDLMKQPAFVLEAVELYHSIKCDIEAKEAKKNQRELEASQKKAKQKRGR